MKRETLITKKEDDYELLDSGRVEKLERFGTYVLVRPDPQALWVKGLPESEWTSADAAYTREDREGKWQINKELPKEWQINFGGLQFIIKPTSFKHTGLFPEQLPNWEWMTHNKIEGSSVLNLFGYTGGATLAAAKAGAKVTHVDASKTAVAWAKENAKASGLDETPIRWIVEDTLTFVRREIKRGVKYEGLIMDPPAFGHGPSGELWKIEESLIELISLCQELLSDNPKFFLINGYAAGYSSLAFAYNLEPLQKKLGGEIEHGDLTIEEKRSGRLLPCGIFARWNK
jgi:23S rRNA (cytosine1962-C5)-methyltransferase